MLINENLKAAIKNYFLAKKQNKGYFPSTVVNYNILETISNACKEQDYGCFIIPGLIHIYSDTENRYFSAFNYWIGRKK